MTLSSLSGLRAQNLISVMHIILQTGMLKPGVIICRSLMELTASEMSGNRLMLHTAICVHWELILNNRIRAMFLYRVSVAL